MPVTDDNYSYETTLTDTNAFAPGFAIEIERTLTGVADELPSVNVLIMTQWRTPSANVLIQYYNVPWIGGLSKQKATITPNLATDIGIIPFANVSGFLYSELTIAVMLGSLTLFNGSANASFRARTTKEQNRGYGVNKISTTCTSYPAYICFANRGGVFYLCPLKLKSVANSLTENGYVKTAASDLPIINNRSSSAKTYVTPPITDEWKDALKELGSTPFMTIYDDPDGTPETIKVSAYNDGDSQATITATFFNKIY